MTESLASNRNIVLITVDSLRADYCYSSDVPTPAMDALAESGARFETAIAPGPATYESMPAIFTGTQPGPPATPGGVNDRERIATHLRAHRPLPERLRERGYTTIGVSPNPFTSRHFGFDTGFDRFIDFLDPSGFAGGLRQRIVSRWTEGEFVGGLRFASNMLGVGDVSVNCSEVVSRAVAAMTDAPEPVFLWLMFLDPHWPYQVPRRHRDGTSLIDRYRANWRASNLSNSTPTDRDATVLRKLYRGTIRGVDDCLATLRAHLASYDPVVIVHADHGEGFGEHGHFGHGGVLYEENIHVPLIVGNVGTRAPVQSPTSLRTIPRLVEGLSDGESDLRAYTTDRTYATSERGDLCVRGPSWKYYVRGDGSGRLYDLRADPEERDGTEADIEAFRTQYSAQLAEIGYLEDATRAELPIHRL